MAYNYEAFKKDVYALTNINLDMYKEKQMKRRIESLMSRYYYTSFEKFFQGLKEDEELLQHFIGYLTINVSEFYRNPSQWQLLEDTILPRLIRQYGRKLTIWSAACSTGDEPYTIAMICRKYLPSDAIKIYATDLDEEVLQRAKLGVYSARSIEGLPEQLKKQYFVPVDNGKNFQIIQEIKDCVEFRKHNLLEDKYFSDVNMVVCRNVVIYFTDEAKDHVYRGFHRSLTERGVLFIGSTEQIMNAKALGFKTLDSFFYEKV